MKIKFERSTKLKLDRNEVQILSDVINLHMVGLLDAKGMTIDDPSILTAEELLDYMSGYDDEIFVLSDILSRLKV